MPVWNDLKQVIAYARQLGPGMIVVKHYDRANYNVTHAERRDLWNIPTVKVLFRT